jgi:tetratricopeptide (TPR) repeat protein
MGDRAVYCARLESVCAERHPGFESPPIRHGNPITLARFCAFRNDLLMRLFLALIVFTTSSLFAADNQDARVGENLVEVARRDFENENFAGAHATLDRFEKSKGPTAESFDLRGCIYMEQGNFDGAAQAFEAAHSAGPSLFTPRLHAGDLFLRQKQYAQARSVYESLLKETKILMSLERLRFAILITYLGEHDESHARSTFDKIAFPTESPAYYYAQAAWAFAHAKNSEAQNWIKSASKIFSQGMIAWFARPLYDLGWIKKKPPLSLYQWGMIDERER